MEGPNSCTLKPQILRFEAQALNLNLQGPRPQDLELNLYLRHPLREETKSNFRQLLVLHIFRTVLSSSRHTLLKIDIFANATKPHADR